MKTFVPLLVFTCLIAIGAQALRCQTEDGPSPEQLQRVIRKCMKRAGMNHDSDDDSKSGSRRGSHGHKGHSSGSKSGHSDSESESESDSEDESGSDSDSDEDSESEEQSDRRNSRRGKNKHDYRHNLRFRRSNGFGGGFGHSGRDGGNSGNGGGYSQQNNTNEYEANCVMNCFLIEMKMTNDKQLPDKRKVVHVLTKDIKDRQLKQFMQDSVNECFQVLDLDRRKEKCEYSRNLITCLAEHGKANCDDWQDSDSLPV